MAGRLLFICSWASSAAQAAEPEGAHGGQLLLQYARDHPQAAALRRQKHAKGQGSGSGYPMVVITSARGC